MTQSRTALCDLTRKITPEVELRNGSELRAIFLFKSRPIFDEIFVELKALELPQP